MGSIDITLNGKGRSAGRWILIAMSGLILRLLLAGGNSHQIDMACFKAWASAASANLFGFYDTGMFADYPPAYIYVLAIVGQIARMLGLVNIQWAYNILIKLPSILADIVTAFIIFRLAEKNMKESKALLISAAYIFNPTVILDSAIWGQVDSFFTMAVIAALYLLSQEKLEASAVLYTLAMLIKPQGIIFLPVLFFEIVRRKDLRLFLRCLSYGAVTFVLAILPFFMNKNPLWIFKLYFNTASYYKGASINAFNLFALLGANWKDASGKLLFFSYNTWGFIFIILIAGFIGFLYIKDKGKKLYALSSLVLITGVFVLSVRMHERYMYPALAIALIAYILSGNFRFIVLYISLTITNFINIWMVLEYSKKEIYWIPADNGVLLAVSLVNILLLIYLISLSLDALKTDKPNKSKHKEIKKSPGLRYSVSKDASRHIPMKLDRTDAIIMSVMTLVYLIIALYNLGGLKVPQTSWQPGRSGEGFTIDLGRTAEISRISYYNGLNSRDYERNKFNIEYETEPGIYKVLNSFVKKDFYKWQYIGTAVKTQKIRIVVEIPGGTLNELAIFEKGKTEPINGFKIVDIKTSNSDKGRVENLFDEQETVEYRPSFMNGTYFDEIYHARTAFESLHLIEPYETTHPPLGKLFIAAGIALFGMNPFGWRIIGTLFGAAMILVMYLFGKKIFKTSFYAFCTAFLMMFDFMHFTQTRIATIDVYVVFFIILMYYFMYDYFVSKSYLTGFKQSLKPLFLSGLCFGLGAASKWIALYGAAGLAFLFFFAKYNEFRDYLSYAGRRSRKPLWVKDFLSIYIGKTAAYCVLFFIVVPIVIYLLSYIPFMMVPGPGHDLSGVLRYQAHMFNYHSSLKAEHSFSSDWWSWPLMIKPVWYYNGSDLGAGRASTIAALGNPAIWWGGIAAAVAAFAIALRRKDNRMIVIFTAILFQYAPWVFVSRLTFIYHFFSVIPFVIICIVYVMKYFSEKYSIGRYLIYGYLCLAAVLFVMFYPVLSGMEVDRNYINSLKWLKSWIF